MFGKMYAWLVYWDEVGYECCTSGERVPLRAYIAYHILQRWF